MVVSHTTLSLRLTAVVGTRGFPSSLDITLDDVHLDHAFLGGELGCYPGVEKVPTQLEMVPCATRVNIRPTPSVFWDLSSVCPEENSVSPEVSLNYSVCSYLVSLSSRKQMV